MQLEELHLTQQAAAVYASISGATLSDILNKDHLPSLDMLSRPAGYSEVTREYAVRLSTHPRPATGTTLEAHP
jgi:transcriptional regulator with XRE-family HTH domain